MAQMRAVMDKILASPQVKRTAWLLVAVVGCGVCLTLVSPGRSLVQATPPLQAQTPVTHNGHGQDDKSMSDEDLSPPGNANSPSSAADSPAADQITTQSNQESSEKQENQQSASSASSGRGWPQPKNQGREGGVFNETKSDKPVNLGTELLISLLLVLVLGGIAFVVIKRLLPRLRWGRLVGQGRKIRLIESVGVGPRQQVHLLEVGGRSLLISTSRDGVRMLADVTDALGGGTDVVSEPKPSEPAPGGFAGILDKTLGGDA